MLRIIKNGNCFPLARIESSLFDGERTLVWPEVYEGEDFAFCRQPIQSTSRDRGNTPKQQYETPLPHSPDTIRQGMKQQLTDRQSILPEGGDRLTEELYGYATEVGKENVSSKGFRVWLSKNRSDFDIAHGTICYRQGNLKMAEVTNDQLKLRIYRLKRLK